jgi:hypothetical protein
MQNPVGVLHLDQMTFPCLKNFTDFARTYGNLGLGRSAIDDAASKEH